MQPKQVVVQGRLTSYLVAGDLTIARLAPVIFLHGWASSKEVWAHLLRQIAAGGGTALALDLPGFGQTQGPTSPWGVADYANFVAEFMAKLKIPSAVLAGHSFGGRVVLKLAAQPNSPVKKLVLIDSAGIRTSAGFKKFLSVIAKVTRPFFRLRWTNPLRRKIYRLIGAEDYVATPELNTTFVKVIGEDLTSLLPQIIQPTLIIWGKNDLVTPLAYGRQFAIGLKNSRLVILENAGHYSFLDQPSACLNQLKQFIWS